MAITEYYVSATGAGSQNGTLGNDLTWAGMITQINSLGAGGGAGRRYNVKGTHARTTTADALTVGGTAASPLIIRGYSSSITDGNQGRSSNNGPLVTTNFGVVTYTTGRLTLGTFTVLESMDVSATSLNNSVIDVPLNSLLVRSNVSISGTGGGSTRAVRLDGVAAAVIDSDFSNTCTTAAAAVLCSGLGNRVIASRVACPNGPAVVVTAGYSAILDNIIADCTIGVSLTSTSSNGVTTTIYGNTFYDCSSECILLPNSVNADDLPIVMNNHMQDNQQSIDSGYAATNDLCVWWSHNREDNTAASDGFDDWQTASNTGNVTTATALEYPGSGDYNLSSGALAIGAGLPKFRSMGALQVSASGGTARPSNPFSQQVIG